MSAFAKLKIGLVEDNPTDAMIFGELLAESIGFEHEIVRSERLEDGVKQSKAANVDVVLLDLGLPDSQGVETFVRFHEQNPDLPVLVLTALNDEAIGIQAMKLGAQDYLIKSQVTGTLLIRSIRYAIERQRVTSELSHSQQQLRKLAARLQAVREEERITISREIHDELGQFLTALKMDVRWVEKKLLPPMSAHQIADLKTRLLDATEHCDKTIECVQRIALSLRPSELDDQGLAEAIRGESHRHEMFSGLQMRLKVPQDRLDLSAEESIALFRIFQELMTNVTRHSKATSVNVHLYLDKTEIVLEVKDNGIGISSDALSHKLSLGLLSMSERAASINGWLQFESESGKGTRAIVRIPHPPK